MSPEIYVPIHSSVAHANYAIKDLIDAARRIPSAHDRETRGAIRLKLESARAELGIAINAIDLAIGDLDGVVT